MFDRAVATQDDPLLTNATNPLFAWFQSFIILEIFFQVRSLIM